MDEIIDDLTFEEMNADERNEFSFNWIRENAPDHVLQYLDTLESGLQSENARLVAELQEARQALRLAKNKQIDKCSEDGCLCDLREPGAQCWSYLEV